MNESINVESLLEISDGDKEFVKEILAIFIENTPIELNQIRTFISENKPDELSQVLHKLRSFTTPLGLRELQSKISRLEKDVKTHEIASLQEELTEFLRCMIEITNRAKHQLEELNT